MNRTKVATVSAQLAFAALAALCASSSALAQQTFTPATSQQAALMAYGQAPVKEIDLSAGVTYDSNVARSDDELAAARGLKESDVIFAPEVTIKFVRPFGPGQVILNADAGYNFYVENHVLNREAIDVLGGYATRILFCQETLTGGYDRHQSDLIDLTLPGQAIQNVISLETVKLAATCGHAIGLSPNFSVAESWRTNSNAILADTNNRTFAATAGVAYQRPAFGALGVFGEFDHVIYTQGIDFFGFSIPDSLDVYAAGVRYDRHLGTRIEGTVTIAYTELVNSFPGAKGFSGLTYDADLTYHAGPRLNAHILLTRATLPSIVPNAQFQVVNTYKADLAYTLSRRLTAKLVGSINDRNYEGVTPFEGFDLTHQILYDVLAEADLSVSHRITLAFTAGEEIGNANLPEFDYLSTRLGLTAKAAF
jgi:hypothetical protein